MIKKEKKVHAKNEWGLESRRGLSRGEAGRLNPSPHSLFPRSCFCFPDYLGAWNRIFAFLKVCHRQYCYVNVTLT